jgi:hypothetical protein
MGMLAFFVVVIGGSLALLALLAELVGRVISATIDFLQTYASHAFPYNIVAAFYYFVGQPIVWGYRAAIFCAKFMGSLTSYEIANVPLRLATVVLFLIGSFWAIRLLFTKTRLGEHTGVIVFGLCAPGLVGLLWYLVARVLA